MADEEYSHVSSSLIKQVTPLTTDEILARFVPREIIPLLRSKLAARESK
jgi:pantetheine-phosphate adenylyltransferase